MEITLCLRSCIWNIILHFEPANFTKRSRAIWNKHTYTYFNDCALWNKRKEVRARCNERAKQKTSQLEVSKYTKYNVFLEGARAH